VRSSRKRNLRNKPVRTQSRTYVSKAREAIASGDLEAAAQEVKQAMIILDKTVQKGVIHKNNAARRKSRLMNSLNAARAGAAAASAPAPASEAE